MCNIECICIDLVIHDGGVERGQLEGEAAVPVRVALTLLYRRDQDVAAARLVARPLVRPDTSREAM